MGELRFMGGFYSVLQSVATKIAEVIQKLLSAEINVR